MRIVLGVDGRHGDTNSVHLVKRLDFGGEAEIDIVHVVESLPFTWWGAGEMSSPDVIQQLIEDQEKAGIRITREVADVLREDVKQTRCIVRHGAASDQLMAQADDANADLIAVGGAMHTPLGALLTGSVGRGLVVGAHQSLLIAKGDVAPEGPVRAVLATDHSAYADKCLTRLLDFAPQSIEHLTVLTAYPQAFIQSVRPFLPEFVQDPGAWVQESLDKRNKEVAARLASLGCTIETRIADQHPNEAIAQVMKETNADLLILGAQGHNWIERLTLGSVSFHQVVAEPYSVLVLRVPKEESVTLPSYTKIIMA
jgi:nucleotide-binding universal stress UspA family protein